MATRCFLLICFAITTLAEPTPGRIPKVYNALITSNQNLEPSKAYPVYQPVLRSAAFPFPLQPVFYGDLPLTNHLLPPPAALPPSAVPKDSISKEELPPQSSEEPNETQKEIPEAPNPQPDSNQGTEAPPPPPKTESPIPLNEFGLPPQVLPLGNFGSGYEFTQINTFPYSYPGLRFYDSYDPFLFNPYANFPLYRPLPNVLAPLPPVSIPKEAPKPSPAPESPAPSQPPSEPSDLNILNYSSKDPAIPNVPPPPLPQGGLKPDAA
ncbi:unnamed protein product [Leptosia nina]|uniref:Uncharacterized protein n=1 Tax=Leptosia nina TaxID=320188 RepID=A0AAV1IVJ9_9NEOP